MRDEFAHPIRLALLRGVLAGVFLALVFAPLVVAAPPDDARIVAALDTQYQLAVKRNDAATMARILHDDFILVNGTGQVFTKADLLKSAHDRKFDWAQQDEEPRTQVVRVWGDTAVVTAKLWIKAKVDGQLIDKRLWFSDTYVRTPAGWRYAFGQASLALPPAP